ncbi:L,D-transpeptidase family protein [Nitrospirota bacterium]
MRLIVLVLLAIITIAAQALAAGSYGYSESREVVGITRSHRVEGKETLYEIARKYNIGYNEVASANPGIKNPFNPGVGIEVALPTKWILPADREDFDVIVNLAEMRLYRLFSSGRRRLVSSYPIGVAIEGFPTPLGRFSISAKLVKPTWIVPASVRQEQPELPEVVPPGEENPLGEYALRLSDSHYFIHGTNKPFGIGMRVSHGCIRLYPEDIVELYSIVGMGSSVKIVYEPVKAGLRAGGLFIEVHEDYLGRVEDVEEHALGMLRERGYEDIADIGLVRRALKEKLGVPVLIGRVGELVKETVEARAKETPEPETPGEKAN